MGAVCCGGGDVSDEQAKRLSKAQRAGETGRGTVRRTSETAIITSGPNALPANPREKPVWIFPLSTITLFPPPSFALSLSLPPVSSFPLFPFLLMSFSMTIVSISLSLSLSLSTLPLILPIPPSLSPSLADSLPSPPDFLAEEESRLRRWHGSHHGRERHDGHDVSTKSNQLQELEGTPKSIAGVFIIRHCMRDVMPMLFGNVWHLISLVIYPYSHMHCTLPLLR